MSVDKEKEAMAGTEDEQTALKVGDTSADASDHDSLPAYPGTDVDTSLNMEDNHLGNDLDNSRARFIPNNEKGDGAATALPEVYVDVDGKTKTKLDEQFVGLTKEELMKFADDPYWKKVRLAFLILFWVGWFGMLAAAIIIIVVAPKCPPRPKLDWWQKSTMYQICPKSYRDSDSDGVGDLNGIHEKIDYLGGKPNSLNVSAVMLGAIYPQGGTSTDGYDVTDYMAIDSVLGTMEDFENLKIAMHKKGLEIIVDFIPNHSSDKHVWFEKSREREAPYTDYYVWHAGKEDGSPPNNWLNVNGGSAWTKDDKREEFYLHQFSAEEPDLNLRNPDVQQELSDILEFWMDQGVDGFQVIAAAHLFECANFTDETLIDPASPVSYENLNHTMTQFMTETYEIITKWREQMDAYGHKNDKVKFLMVDASGDPDQLAPFFKYQDKYGAHMPRNTELVDLGPGCDAKCIYEKIHAWVDLAQELDIWSNWQTGNKFNSRVLSRFNEDENKVNTVNMLLLTLPGSSLNYYGEEIGMHDLNDGISFNKYRSPMQWTPDAMSGFTDGNTTLIPLPDDYEEINVRTEQAHGKGVSKLEVFQSLVKLREEPSFQWGDLKIGVVGDILFIVRQAEGFPGYLVAINFGNGPKVTIDFVTNSPEPDIIPGKAKIVAHTANFPDAGGDYEIGTEAPLDNLVLDKDQGIIFKWEASAMKK